MKREKTGNREMVPASFKLVGIFILTGIFFISGCGKVKKIGNEEDIIPVKTLVVELQNITKTLDYVGDIKAQAEAVIYPKVSGKIIEELKEEGSSVNKGDVIAYIDRDEVGFKFEKAPVESSLKGIVGRVYVDRGGQVSPQTPVALVVDMDNVLIELDVPERYLPEISSGQSAQVYVDAYPTNTFIGKVDKISPVLDSSTRTAPVEILIPNNEHLLKSGMYARVKLLMEEHSSTVVVFKEAVLGKEPYLYVYVVKEGVAYKREVKLGLSKEALCEIVSGLNQGEEVVVLGQQRLYDGAKVRVEMKDGK